MNIVLVNLPWVRENRYGVRAGSRWPFTLPFKQGKKLYLPFPFFLAYTTSLLKSGGSEALLIDAVAEGIDEAEFIKRVKERAPDVVIAESSTPSFFNDCQILARLKCSLPRTKIVLCGTHVSALPSQVLEANAFIDYIAIGEYEHTIFELIEQLTKKEDVSSVVGLAYRRDGTIQFTPPRPNIKTLDCLPWPERETLPLYNYNDGFCNLPQPNVQMLTSRGCPSRCSFCLWPQVIYRDHTYRKRTPQLVVVEMQWLLQKYQFKAVYFDDDTFTIDRGHVRALCEEMTLRNIHIPWACMGRPDHMDERILEVMVSAGLYAIKYGVESANQDILNRCRKNMSIAKTKEVISFTQRLGVKTHLTFCLGLPGETKETIQQSVDFITEMAPDSVQFSLATPFPGTELFNCLQAAGHLASQQWYDYDGNCKAVASTGSLSTEELERELQRVRDVLNEYEQTKISK